MDEGRNMDDKYEFYEDIRAMILKEVGGNSEHDLKQAVAWLIKKYKEREQAKSGAADGCIVKLKEAILFYEGEMTYFSDYKDGLVKKTERMKPLRLIKEFLDCLHELEKAIQHTGANP